MLSSLLPLIKGLVITAASEAIKPVVRSLIKSVINPKFLLDLIVEAAEALAGLTETEFDDRRVQEIKVMIQADIEKLEDK